MNQKSDFFTLTIVLTLAFCLLLIYRFSNKSDFRSEEFIAEIKKFDKRNASIINSFTDSLVKSVGNDFTYSLERRRDGFSIIKGLVDSAGESGSYYGLLNNLTNEQSDFVWDEGVTRIYFDQASQTFSIISYAFEDDHKAIEIRVTKKNTLKLLSNKREIVYSNGNRTYLLIDSE